MSDKVTLTSVSINPQPTYDYLVNKPTGSLVRLEIEAFIDSGMDVEVMLREILDQALAKILKVVEEYEPGVSYYIGD